MSLLEVVDLSRITREEGRVTLDHMEAITIDLIQILKLSEIQASLRTEETKKAIIIKTKNKTTRTMAAIHIRSLSSSQRIQLLLRNRATSSTEIMMSRRKNQCQRSRNRKSSSLCMRMLEMIRMPLIMVELLDFNLFHNSGKKDAYDTIESNKINTQSKIELSYIPISFSTISSLMTYVFMSMRGFTLSVRSRCK